jgi:hypothetical protein
MQSKAVLLAAILLALCAAGCGGQGGASGPAPEQIRQLAQGMPEAEVRRLLGEPARIQELKYDGAVVSHTWYYGRGESESTVVMIDGKVSNAYQGKDNTPLFAEPEEALDDGDDGG